MREPKFWRKSGLIPRLLAPISFLYAIFADARMHRASKKAGVPVLCVGNLTLGGSGKTPTAIVLAKMLLERGERPFFLTRGYGGKLKGPILVGPEHTARQVGDEALLLARVAPTIVAINRVAGAAVAVDAGASVIVMDDGFQNPSLAKDFSLIVIDGESGPGNGRVFPSGPLRATLQTQIGLADAVLVIGAASHATRLVTTRMAARRLPVLSGKFVPDPVSAEKLRGRNVLAYTGIGRPEKFFETLRACGVILKQTRTFADHHIFTAKEATAIMEAAGRERLYLVTTEKDMARMRGDDTLTMLARSSNVLPVTVAIEELDAVKRDVIDAVRAAAPAKT
jgi:tetraacyldisaccharide 4'-kinase